MDVRDINWLPEGLGTRLELVTFPTPNSQLGHTGQGYFQHFNRRAICKGKV